MTTPSQTPETARTAEQAYDIRQREEWKAIRADILLMDEINSRDGLFLADAIYNAIERLERRLTPPQASKGGGYSPGRIIDAAYLARQREFSERTFGPGARTKGVIDHIRKELVEIEADPADVKEWVDVVILALDGAWRAGWEPQAIIDAIHAKQAANEARQWPDWRTQSQDRAIEHVRASVPPTPAGETVSVARAGEFRIDHKNGWSLWVEWNKSGGQVMVSSTQMNGLCIALTTDEMQRLRAALSTPITDAARGVADATLAARAKGG